LWFVDAFTKRKRTRNLETRSVKHVNPHCSFMLLC
jgi:hypothetical protein